MNFNSLKASFSTKKFKGGAYTTVISLAVIVILFFVNIIASELELKLDLSEDSKYTLTDETVELINGLEDNITIYYMVQTGTEDEIIKRIIDKYDSISDKVKVEYKDPILNPLFASQYVEDTVTNNSFVVVNNSNNRVKYIDNADLFEQEIDYTTYTTYTSAVDVEGQVTSALLYVTNEELPVLYTVEGHGETALSDTINSSLDKINVTSKSISTLTVTSIPSDCKVLLINAPQSDYSTEEIDMIKEYLAAGGNAVIFADYGAEGLTNFNSLLNYYGVSLVNGIVLEGDSNHIMGQYVNNLIPDLDSHTITSSIMEDGVFVVTPVAKGIEILDSARSTITIEPLLTTSDSSFSKTDMNSETIAMEEGDIEGPFDLGVAITEEYNDDETNLIVYGTPYLIDDGMITYPSLGNLDLFLNTINFTTGQESQTAIQAKTLLPGYLTLTAAQANMWAIIVVIIIPVALLTFGGYVTVKRRKK
jgi:ABC-2 type transport system permease protein